MIQTIVTAYIHSSRGERPGQPICKIIEGHTLRIWSDKEQFESYGNTHPNDIIYGKKNGFTVIASAGELEQTGIDVLNDSPHSIEGYHPQLGNIVIYPSPSPEAKADDDYVKFNPLDAITRTVHIDQDPFSLS